MVLFWFKKCDFFAFWSFFRFFFYFSGTDGQVRARRVSRFFLIRIASLPCLQSTFEPDFMCTRQDIILCSLYCKIIIKSHTPRGSTIEIPFRISVIINWPKDLAKYQAMTHFYIKWCQKFYVLPLRWSENSQIGTRGSWLPLQAYAVFFSAAYFSSLDHPSGSRFRAFLP